MGILRITYFVTEAELETAFDGFEVIDPGTITTDFSDGNTIISYGNGFQIQFLQGPAGEGEFDGYRFLANGVELIRVEGIFSALNDGFFYEGIEIVWGSGDSEFFGFDFLKELPQAPVSFDGIEAFEIDLGDGEDVINLDFARDGFSYAVDGDTVTVTTPDGSYSFRGLDRVALDDGAWLFGVDGDDIDYVYGLYAASLGRTPDAEGFLFWNEVAKTGEYDKTGLADFFVESPEFAAIFEDGITDEAFVGRLYNDILGREEDPDGFEFWLEQVGNGFSKSEMLKFFVDSPEYLSQFDDDVSDGIWVLPESEAAAI